MKINRINIILAFAISLFFASCEKEIKFKGDVTASRLVLNSIVTAGEPLTATLGKSVFFMYDTAGASYGCPENAQMSLYVNGNFVETLSANGDMFSGSYTPSVGDTIRLTATAPDFDDVEATTMAIPDAPSFTYNTVLEHFETSSYIIDDTVYYCIAAKGQIIIDLYDTNPNGRDCYYISIIESDFYDIQKFTFNDPIFENINEPVLDEIYSTSRPFFSDKIFDGSQYQLKIPFVISSINNTEYTSEAEFEIVLEHIDMNLYEYYNTLYVANSDDYGPLSEPAHIHSNVNGGYGIVAGQNCDTIIIKVSQER